MIGLYARVSTEEQAKHGYSLSDQIRQCRKKANSENVREYIDDGYSGEFLERPGLDSLRRDVKDGIIDKIVIFDPDRWSRNLMNQLLVTDEIEKRAEIVFVNGEYDKTPEGRLFYQMRGAISEFEKAKIKERMTNGRREKARKGRVLRDFKIYGYSYDPENRKIIINEDEAKIVQLIFDLFTNPNKIAVGINGIAKYLTESGVPTKRQRGSGIWHKQVVRQILMNRCYIGEFYQNKWNTEGMLGNKHRPKEDKIKTTLRPREDWISLGCPAIINEQQFETTQKLLGESRRRFAKESLRPYLLSGLLRCGDCGNTMTGRASKNWGKFVLEYTDVKNTAGSKNKGCGNKMRCIDLDDQIWTYVHAHLSGELNNLSDDDQIQPSTLSFEEMELEVLEKEMEKVKGARKRLVKLFSAEDMDEAGENEVREQLKELTTKENSISVKIMTIKDQLSHQKSMKYSEINLRDASEYYLKLDPEAITFEDKKALIRMVVREIRVYKDRADVFLF